MRSIACPGGVALPIEMGVAQFDEREQRLHGRKGRMVGRFVLLRKHVPTAIRDRPVDVGGLLRIDEP